MSLKNRIKKASALAIDQLYVIYGKAGTGKTVLASTFPHKKNGMLIVDILEGGTASVAREVLEDVDVIQIEKFEEFDEIVELLITGELVYDTIAFDSVTGLEFILKEYLKTGAKKDTMTLQLWGQASDKQDHIVNFLKKLHQLTKSIVVAIAHEKEIKDEDNPGFNKIIPALMTKASNALAAKASYVWYTTIEAKDELNSATGKVERTNHFVTYIDAHPLFVTKCRKPKDMKVPQKVTDLTFDKFKKGVLDPMTKKPKAKPAPKK